MAKMTLRSEFPDIATSARERTNTGKACTTSATRMTPSAIQPRMPFAFVKNATKMPSNEPKTNEMSVPDNAIRRSTRGEAMTRLYAALRDGAEVER